MQSFNTKFITKSQLIEFIKNNILKNKTILVQVFSGILDEKIIQDVIDILKDNIQNVKIIGSTTDGEIIGDEVTTKEIVINFTVFEKTTVKTAIIEKIDIDDFELGSQIAQRLKENNTKAMVLFADGLNTNGEDFVRGVESQTSALIAGGLAGDNAEFKKTLVFNEEKIILNGCVGASLNSDELIAHNRYEFNWHGIGKIMTVTKADKNRVYEIDGKSVVDIYRYYFGEEIAKDVVKVGVEFPLIINKNGVKIARAVVSQNDDGSLILAGNIETGDKVQFGFGNAEAILKDSVVKEVEDVESIFVYSCMARRRFLGENIKYEIEPLSKIANVSGFFTYGEFFQMSQNYLLNQTMTILFLSETKNKKVADTKLSKKENLLTLNVLSHLIDVTSKELIELNNELEDKVREKTVRIKAKNLELEYLYYHDDLTDLPNKNAYHRDVLKENPIGSLLIDIKKFSSVNDVYGEKIGDLILKEFAKAISKKANECNCNIYRISADQFMILNLTDDRMFCKKVANKIFTWFKNNSITLRVGSEKFNIDLPVRIAMVPKTQPDLYKIRADLALNYAKKHKKDFVIYSEELRLEDTVSKELKTIEMVKKAIEEDRIVPVFQKIAKKDGDSYECLIRIKENDKLISPFFFLDTIKHTRYYQELTKIMIKKSFEYFKNKDCAFSINFSFQDIIQKDTVNYLCDMIEEYKMYNRVIVELLESEAIEDFSKVEEFLEKIRSYGCKVAIDDFGSGYSNFIYLVEINPDFIKIDGSLIKNIDKDKKSLIITKNINNFVKEIGCKTIAEFVHNKEVFDIVNELNIDGIQGYYLAEPKEEI
jgi:diguanylate cyclase (GGDEF)-like protein